MHENLTSVCLFFVVNVEEKVQAFFRAQNLKPMLNLPPTYPLLNLSICVLSLGRFGYHNYRPGLTISFPGIFIFPPFSCSDKAERYENLVTRLLARLGVIVEYHCECLQTTL